MWWRGVQGFSDYQRLTRAKDRRQQSAYSTRSYVATTDVCRYNRQKTARVQLTRVATRNCAGCKENTLALHPNSSALIIKKNLNQQNLCFLGLFISYRVITISKPCQKERTRKKKKRKKKKTSAVYYRHDINVCQVQYRYHWRREHNTQYLSSTRNKYLNEDKSSE